MYEAKITGHQFSCQPNGTEEEVTEGEVEHQQGGAGPQVRVLSFVSASINMIRDYQRFISFT